MRIGEVFRYAAGKDPGPPFVDGVPNFWHATSTPGCKRAQLEKGVNPIAGLKGIHQRVPAILLSSSPHKRGSDATPWEDQFDPDVGRARYFGDSKISKPEAPQTPGNRALLSAYRQLSSSVEPDRATGPPILLFRRVSVQGRRKGFVEFQGLGVVEAASLVTQVDPSGGLPFTNFVFDIAVLDQSQEQEVFDWRWISDRRDPSVSAEASLRFAPEAWRKYIRGGAAILPSVRRSAASLKIISKEEQLPEVGSKEESALRQILAFYEGRKHRFEVVAELIASRVLGGSSGQRYTSGWVSERGGDGGLDFIGRLDVGSGFAIAKLIVLGQAKCEQSATSGRDIARTVARLRRGWIGCYVTTSYFSKPVQTEVIEDKYPLVLVHGRRVARELLALQMERGVSTVTELLGALDETYDSRLSDRDPEQVLHL